MSDDPRPEFQIVRADTLIATAHSRDAAEAAATLLAHEFRVPRGRMIVLYPPDYVVPTFGGGTATAREVGLPLTSEGIPS